MNICPNVQPTRNSTPSHIGGARLRSVDCSRGGGSVWKRIDQRRSPLCQRLARKRAPTGRDIKMEGFLGEWGARGKPALLRACSGKAARLGVNGSVAMTLEVARHGPATQRRWKWLLETSLEPEGPWKCLFEPAWQPKELSNWLFEQASELKKRYQWLSNAPRNHKGPRNCCAIHRLPQYSGAVSLTSPPCKQVPQALNAVSPREPHLTGEVG